MYHRLGDRCGVSDLLVDHGQAPNGARSGLRRRRAEEKPEVTAISCERALPPQQTLLCADRSCTGKLTAY